MGNIRMNIAQATLELHCLHKRLQWRKPLHIGDDVYIVHRRRPWPVRMFAPIVWIAYCVVNALDSYIEAREDGTI